MNAKDANFSQNEAVDKAGKSAQAFSGLAEVVSISDDMSGPSQFDAWRKHCLEGRETFPAGVTYLGQLMAHDLTQSAGLDNDIAQAPAKTKRKINLRRNQLLLDTLYGEGPSLDPQLFGGKQLGLGQAGFMFRLLELNKSKAGLIKTVPSFSVPITGKEAIGRCRPILADIRNSDNPMVMRMATIFMMYHNLMARRALVGEGTGSDDYFLEARIKTTLAWHKIIRHDIIDQVCMIGGARAFKTKLAAAMSKKPDAIEADFLHGVLRAFHSLSIPKYLLSNKDGAQFGEVAALVREHAVSPRAINLAHPDRLKLIQILQDWQRKWDIDLSEFFDFDQAAQNRTAFTPSYALSFLNRVSGDSDLVVLRDRTSAEAFCVSKLSDPLHKHLIAKCEAMIAELNDTLGTGFALSHAKDFPLHLAFLAEAHVDGKRHGTGTLGRTGSALFLKVVEAKIKAAQKLLGQHVSKGTIKAWYAEAPSRFHDLAHLVAPETVGPGPGSASS